MLQRDYIQRLIREFMAALERMLEKKEVEVRREKIKELYNQYVGPYAFYSIATIEDVMKAMAGIDDEEKRLSKMDMLAELYYHEADMVGQPTRDELLNKAFMLFDYVETHGDTFSIERRNKMAQIKQKIGQLVARGPVSASPSPTVTAQIRSGLSNTAPNACAME